MSERIALDASMREGTGKGAARALRREGKVPAVIYGDNQEPVTISLEHNEVNKEYYKGHFFTSLTELDIDGKQHLVLARDVQTHLLNDRIEHVDFLRVSKKTKIPVSVPVKFINEAAAPGLAAGILNVTRYDVEVFCSALEIPEEIEVDLTGADIGDVIKSSSITLPEGIEFTIADRDFTIAAIEAPKKAAAAAEETEEAAAEGDAEAAEGDAEAAEEGASE